VFYDKLKLLCAQHKTSPSALAVKLGLGRSNVTRWKNGLIPSGKTLLKFAEYFDVSVDYFLRNDSGHTAHNIHNSAVAQGQHAKAINGGANAQQTEDLAELSRIFMSLDVRARHKLMQTAFELEGAM
jgi:transcriptional regulator with XRE-family HTH domain